MTIRYKLFGTPRNLEEFLEKAKRDNEKKICFEIRVKSHSDINLAIADNFDLEAKVYVSYLSREGETRVWTGKSGRIAAPGLLEDEAKKYRKFEERVMKVKEDIKSKVLSYGMEFQDITEHGKKEEEKPENGDKVEIPPVETNFVDPWEIQVPKYKRKNGKII